MGVANGNVGLAFGLVIAAGLSTTIGSAFVFCSSYANTKLLAAALGVSAGVMIYVSFVEIFSIKAVEGFSTEYGNDASKMATLCFFCGAGITHLLDRIVHRIGAWQKKKSATTRSFSETPQGDTPQGDFISETMQRRYAEGEFGEPSNFDIVRYN